MIKNLPANAGDARHENLISGLGNRWSRKWQPTALFLPGKFHQQKSLVGYNPWGRRDSDVTE